MRFETDTKMVVLGGWSALQPSEAPPIDVIEAYNAFRGLFGDRQEIPAEEARWEKALTAYNFHEAEAFDLIIFRGVKNGFFDDASLTAEAVDIQAKTPDGLWEDNSFVRAWHRYHQSFLPDDDDVLTSVADGLSENMATSTHSDLNVTVKLLREFGLDDRASDLICGFIEQDKPATFFDLRRHPFGGDIDDQEFVEALIARRAAWIDTRDPLDVLIKIAEGKGYNEEDTNLLAKLSVAEFEALLDRAAGPDLREIVIAALKLGGGGYPSAKVVGRNATAALRAIAGRSPMNRRRVESYGIQLGDHDNAAGQDEAGVAQAEL